MKMAELEEIAGRAQAKLDRGESITLDEQEAVNELTAQRIWKAVRADMQVAAERRPNAVMFRQGDFDAIRVGVRLAIQAVFHAAAFQSVKRRELEARVAELRSRLTALEERSGKVQGTYDPKKTYRAFDIVALGGASFIARRDEPGPCPGDGWQLSAQQGKRGQPGPRVRSMTVNGEGMLTLINSDGSIVKCDLYPLLAKIGGRS